MTDTGPEPAVFPVTKWQQYLLDEAEHPDATDDFRERNLLSNAFLVSSGIDLRRARRAVQKLFNRHDSLRIRFARIKGKWRALIAPSVAEMIHVVDLDGLDDAAFLARVSDLANAAMPLVDTPLAQIIIGRSGSRGDVLITRVHHAITDGHGMLLLIEDLIKFLMGIPIFGRAISHADYIAHHQSPPPSRAAEIDAFWKNMHRDPPKAPNVGRRAKGLEPLLHAAGRVKPQKMRCTVTAESLQRLEERATSGNNTATRMLFAGYLEALCQCYDLDRVIFSANVGRTDPAIYTYMGLHTLTPIMIYRSQGAQGFSDAAQAFGDMFVQAMDHLPADAAWRHSEAFYALIKAGAYPTQFSLRQPDPKSPLAHSTFREGFYKNFDEEQRIGPFKFTPLDVSVKRRNFADMALDVGPPKRRTGFEIYFDAISFTQAEVRTLGDKMCHLTGLEQEEVVFA